MFLASVVDPEWQDGMMVSVRRETNGIMSIGWCEGVNYAISSLK